VKIIISDEALPKKKLIYIFAVRGPTTVIFCPVREYQTWAEVANAVADKNASFTTTIKVPYYRPSRLNWLN